jgi:hypothetical protein
MPGLNPHVTYFLFEEYETIKENTRGYPDKYLNDPTMIQFNDAERSITFSTEKLIPISTTGRPQVMLLFSNPHPYSVYQGMFLSPNRRGVENAFWSVMEEAGWLPIKKENRNPTQLADICLNVKYPGSFALIFYCYYAFPTDFPKDIRKIFGKKYFNQKIEPKALDEFQKTIEGEHVEAVVTFNKEIFNLVSTDPIDRYVDRLMEGKLIQSKIKGNDRGISIYLTFPTGWRYCDRQFRTKSLKKNHGSY